MEEVDGEVVDVNSLETALRSAGVALRDSSGEIREFDDLIFELSSKWDSLDSMTRKYVQTAAAGSRQQSRFIALLSNNARLTELVTAANNAAGASNEQYTKTLESMQTSLTRLSNAWDTFTTRLADNDILKASVDALTWILTQINNLVEKAGELSGSIGEITTSVLLMVGAFKLVRRVQSVFGLIDVQKTGIFKALGESVKNHFAKRKEAKKETENPLGENFTKYAKENETTIKKEEQARKENTQAIEANSAKLKEEQIEEIKTDPNRVQKEEERKQSEAVVAQKKEETAASGEHVQVVTESTKTQIEQAEAIEFNTKEQEKNTAIVKADTVAETLSQKETIETAGAQDVTETQIRELGNQATMTSLQLRNSANNNLLKSGLNQTENQLPMLPQPTVVPQIAPRVNASLLGSGSSGTQAVIPYTQPEVPSEILSLPSKTTKNANASTLGGMLPGLTIVLQLMAGGQVKKLVDKLYEERLAGILNIDEQLENVEELTKQEKERASQLEEERENSSTFIAELSNMQKALQNGSLRGAEYTRTLLKNNEQVEDLVSQYSSLRKYVKYVNGVAVTDINFEHNYNEELERAQSESYYTQSTLQTQKEQLENSKKLNEIFKTNTVTQQEEAEMQHHANMAGIGGMAYAAGAIMSIVGAIGLATGFLAPAGAALLAQSGTIIGISGKIGGAVNQTQEYSAEKAARSGVDEREIAQAISKIAENKDVRDAINNIENPDQAPFSSDDLLRSTTGNRTEIYGERWGNLVKEIKDQGVSEDVATSIQNDIIEAINDGKTNIVDELVNVAQAYENRRNLYMTEGRQAVEAYQPNASDTQKQALTVQYAYAQEDPNSGLRPEPLTIDDFDNSTDKVIETVKNLDEGYTARLVWNEEENKSRKIVEDAEGNIVYDEDDEDLNDLNTTLLRILNAQNQLQAAEKFIRDKNKIDDINLAKLIRAKVHTSGYYEDLQDVLFLNETYDPFEDLKNVASQIGVEYNDFISTYFKDMATDFQNAGLSYREILKIGTNDAQLQKLDDENGTTYEKQYRKLVDSINESIQNSNDSIKKQYAEILTGQNLTSIEGLENYFDELKNFVQENTEIFDSGDLESIDNLKKGFIENFKESHKLQLALNDFSTKNSLKQLQSLQTSLEELAEVTGQVANKISDQTYQLALSSGKFTSKDFVKNTDGTYTFVGDKNVLEEGLREYSKTIYEDSRRYQEAIKSSDFKDVLNEDRDMVEVNRMFSDYLNATDEQRKNFDVIDLINSQTFYDNKGHLKLHDWAAQLLGENFDVEQNWGRFEDIDGEKQFVQQTTFDPERVRQLYAAAAAGYSGDLEQYQQDVNRAYFSTLDTAGLKTELEEDLPESTRKDLQAIITTRLMQYDGAYEEQQYEQSQRGFAIDSTEYANLLMAKLESQEMESYMTSLKTAISDHVEDITQKLNGVETEGFNSFVKDVQSYGGKLGLNWDRDFITEHLQEFKDWVEQTDIADAAEAYKKLIRDNAQEAIGENLDEEQLNELFEQLTGDVLKDLSSWDGDFEHQTDAVKTFIKKALEIFDGNIQLLNAFWQSIAGSPMLVDISSEINSSDASQAGRIVKTKYKVEGIDKEYDSWKEAFDAALQNQKDGSRIKASRSITTVNYGYNPSGFPNIFSTDTLGAESETNYSSWENPYDRQYNLLKKIEHEQENRNRLETEYNSLQKAGVKTSSEYTSNLEQQQASLTKERAQQQQLLQNRRSEIALINQEYAGQQVNGRDITSFVSWDKNGTLQIDWSGIQALESLTETLTDEQVKERELLTKYIDEIETTYESIEETTSTIKDIDEQQLELAETQQKAAADLADKVQQGLIQQRQDEIDRLSKVSEAISTSNSKLLDSIRSSIDKMRQDRENAETAEELDEKRRRLAYLQLDTSGASDNQIRQLQEEIKDQEQSYRDSLVDQKIDELEEQNQFAEDQRQMQIELLQQQLEQMQNNPDLQAIQRIIAEGLSGNKNIVEGSQLDQLLKLAEGWKTQASVEKQNQIEQSNAQLVGEQNANVSGGSTTTSARTSSSTVSSNGASSEIKSEQAALVASYGKQLGSKDEGYNNEIQPVINLQSALNDITNAGLDVDGSFGEQTKNAVENFQRWQGLGVDGHVGAKTRAAFKKFQQYKTGGAVYDTGIAWLDGTPSRPEYVLNAAETQNFFALRDILSESMRNGAFTTQKSGDVYYQIDLKVEGGISSDYDVDRIISKVKSEIVSSQRSRNTNAIALGR